MPIKRIYARQIFDSRGNPTVEVDLLTDKGLFRAAVPSGASTGIHEALELRDNDKSKYMGKGVSKAVNNVNQIIAPQVVAKNFDVTDQTAVDEFMCQLDGTENKGKLGANAVLGVSLAVCKAGAAQKGVPLYRHIADLAGNSQVIMPVPAFNVINGGCHAGNKLALQEFMLIPIGAPQRSSAWTPLPSVMRVALPRTSRTTRRPWSSSWRPSGQLAMRGKIFIGMDCAASEFFKDGKYDLDFKNPNSDPSKYVDPGQLQAMYEGFIRDYPVISIEDPFEQDHWDAWTAFNASTKIQIVGDDLTVTNPKRIQTAIDKNACNCLLLKVNQIGSVTEAIRAHQLARKNGWGTMVSHRSGETEDSTIADIAVGLSTGQIKTGAPCRSERLCKYNQMLRIEEQLGSNAIFAGLNYRHPQP
ncbi:hypothetical protein MTO96_026688 [Rhipicephalus appendiculatus]